MTKNIISHEFAVRLPPDKRLTLLLMTYNLKYENITQIIRKEGRYSNLNHQGDIVKNLALEIFEGSLKKGMSKATAAAQITVGNIAMAMPLKHDGCLNERRVGNVFSRHFSYGRLEEEKRLRDLGLNIELKNPHVVRMYVLEEVLGKKITPNFEKAFSIWGKDLEISPFDLLAGTTLPYKILEKESFLLGFYYADGIAEFDTGRFMLFNNKDERKFLEKTIKTIVEDTFKLEPYIDENCHSGNISYNSQLHNSFLKKINFNNNGNVNFPDFDEICPQKLTPKQLIKNEKAFLYGLTAGLARTNKSRTKRHPHLLKIYKENMLEPTRNFIYDLGYVVNSKS
ncbi:hypothetical protein ACFL1H_07070, partial [Nanoarchaeota archaeon]